MTFLRFAIGSKRSLTKANTPTNFISGFKKAGILPFNRHAFEEHEFAPAFATDLSRPEVTAKNMIHSVDAVVPCIST